MLCCWNVLLTSPSIRPDVIRSLSSQHHVLTAFALGAPSSLLEKIFQHEKETLVPLDPAERKAQLEKKGRKVRTDVPELDSANWTEFAGVQEYVPFSFDKEPEPRPQTWTDHVSYMDGLSVRTPGICRSSRRRSSRTAGRRPSRNDFSLRKPYALPSPLSAQVQF